MNQENTNEPLSKTAVIHSTAIDDLWKYARENTEDFNYI